MKIVTADVFDYRLNYVHGEYVMSGGRAALHQVGTLVRLRTDDGLDGWGEITPLGSNYLPTSPRTVRAALAEMLPELIGLDPTNVSSVNRVMDAVLLGQGYAKSAVDIACWDLLGKVAGLPISALLGGVLQEDFPIYEAVPLGSPQSMADFITARREAGIVSFQLKVGNRPADDIARARACAEAGGGNTVIIADSNGGWNILDAQLAMRGMEDLPIYVEQPCRTTQDSIIAHRNCRLPLVLDESITNPTELFEAKTVAGAMAVNVKISRVGGLTNTARMRDLVQELNMMVSVEDMWGGDVITAAVSHIAASTRPENLLSTSFFNDWTDGHVAGYTPRSVNGRGSAPTEPGLGITVDDRALGEPIFTTAGLTTPLIALSDVCGCNRHVVNPTYESTRLKATRPDWSSHDCPAARDRSDARLHRRRIRRVIRRCHLRQPLPGHRQGAQHGVSLYG